MKVLVAMSGGVDSSVAAARLLEAGHEVVGVTMKLWGGESDTGCCSVSDVDDARRVAQQLGIPHHVWTFTDDFERHVVEPYVEAHRVGLTPNPCIECNRHLKFDRLLRRADAVGFDAVATGHHARVVRRADGTRRLARGADTRKDQSYVLYVLGQAELARTLLPVGDLTKDEVRAEGDGREVGSVPAVELVTVGQRRGLGLAGGGEPQYVVDVDVPGATVRVGTERDLLTGGLDLDHVVWAAGPVTGPLVAQCSAHGRPRAVSVESQGHDRAHLEFDEPQRRVAAGQSVVLYDGDEVVGGGLVTHVTD